MWNFLISRLWGTWTRENDLIFLFAALTQIQFFRINCIKILLVWQIEQDGVRIKKFEAARIHFLTDAFAAVAILDAKVPFQYGGGIRGYDRYRHWKKKKNV